MSYKRQYIKHHLPTTQFSHGIIRIITICYCLPVSCTSYNHERLPHVWLRCTARPLNRIIDIHVCQLQHCTAVHKNSHVQNQLRHMIRRRTASHIVHCGKIYQAATSTTTLQLPSKNLNPPQLITSSADCCLGKQHWNTGTQACLCQKLDWKTQAQAQLTATLL
jgi:hypothetical protein